MVFDAGHSRYSHPYCRSHNFYSLENFFLNLVKFLQMRNLVWPVKLQNVGWRSGTASKSRLVRLLTISTREQKHWLGTPRWGTKTELDQFQNFCTVGIRIPDLSGIGRQLCLVVKRIRQGHLYTGECVLWLVQLSSNFKLSCWKKNSCFSK